MFRPAVSFRQAAGIAALCLLAFGAAGAPVRAQSASDPIYVFHTAVGDMDVQLYPDVAPQTVANFLRYVNSGAYTNSFFHRSVPGFIVQGGGFRVQSDSSVGTVPAFAPVINEFHLSNTRGTLAMAKLGGDPNSATSQWFFNESDSNAGNLDNQNGGFTVFGKIADAASYAVLDKLAALPTYDLSSSNSAFGQIPLTGYQSGPVQISNLATITSISLSTGARLLWNNADGRASLWNYSTADGSFTQNTYGPYPGWTAKAIADGTDAKTRLLWTNTNGTMSLWSLDNTTGSFTQFSFGPYAGWTANAVSVGTNNTTHILWNNTSGAASIWNYETASGAFTQNTYGPYPGWTAKAIADGGTDGKTRLLWDNADGRMSLWSLDNTAGTFAQFSFGPYGGWTANAVSVAADNITHILWNNADGRASLWNYSTADGSFTQNTYGPYSGWTAKAIADGPDGKTRIQWDNIDGTASLWSLNNSTGVFSQFSFGPYSGWTAATLAAGA